MLASAILLSSPPQPSSPSSGYYSNHTEREYWVHWPTNVFRWSLIVWQRDCKLNIAKGGKHHYERGSQWKLYSRSLPGGSDNTFYILVLSRCTRLPLPALELPSRFRRHTITRMDMNVTGAQSEVLLISRQWRVSNVLATWLLGGSVSNLMI